MTMGENDAIINDQKEVVVNGGSGRNSPWKKPAERPAESPVMGEKIWPALTDVQRAKTAEAPNTDSQVTQNSDGHKKSNGGGNGNSSHKHWQQRYNRGRPKKSQIVGPPFPVPLVPRVAFPPAGPFLPPVRGHAYGYQPLPAPFPVADNCFGKSGSRIPMKAFSSPLHGMDASQNFQPPARGDQAVNASKYSVERIPNTAENGVPGGHMYLYCPRPWPFDPKGGIIMQENMTPRACMRPAFVRPAPFIGGPAFPGPRRMHYRPRPPPVYIRPPFPHWIAPQMVNPWACGPPPESLPLRAAIVKQIEYYFSDENLLTDHYLISQMDDQGWVPISVIANFKRLKRMCTDTRFILDALQCSSSVEVQGNNVRKCYSTPKYAENSPAIAIDVKNNLPSEGKTDSTTGGESGSLSESDSKVDVSSDSQAFEGSADNAAVTSYEPSDIRNLPFTDGSEDANSETEATEVLLCSAANVDKLSNVLSGALTV